MKSFQISICAILVIAFCGNGAVAACDTPMPKDIKIASAAALPTDQAHFLGLWNGKWSPGDFCASLAIEEIDPNGVVHLTYAYQAFSVPRGGGQPPLFIKESADDYVGRLEGGEVKFTSKLGSAISVKFDNGRLLATGVTRSGTRGQATFTKQ
jgi:hypothetical protein